MPFQTLPVWVQLSAFFLAFNAGMVNALGLLNIWHQTVSHMTGNVSMLAIAIVHGQFMHAIYIICVISSFVFDETLLVFLFSFNKNAIQFPLGDHLGFILTDSLSVINVFRSVDSS